MLLDPPGGAVRTYRGGKVPCAPIYQIMIYVYQMAGRAQEKFDTGAGGDVVFGCASRSEGNATGVPNFRRAAEPGARDSLVYARCRPQQLHSDADVVKQDHIGFIPRSSR